MNERIGAAFPEGFRAVGVPAGLKGEGREDVALIASDRPAELAAVFTTNRFVAAPVTYCRGILEAGRPVRGVVINAKNANAGTGADGLKNAEEMARAAAAAISCAPHEVLVSSTGVIGRPMPMEKILPAIAAAGLALSRGSDGAAASRAIMTTDTRPKTVSREKNGVRLGGMAKGAGMIHPNMATMLGFLTTDAVVDRERLQRALARAVERTFNSISIDNDMSTNDTVLLLSNGASGRPAPPDFEKMLEDACRELALMIVGDGEGATKVVTIEVSGAASEAEARHVGDTIATSMLVKTAIHGGDPNWGRILAAVGRSGATYRIEKVRIRICGELVFEKNLPVPVDLSKLGSLMKDKEILIQVDLGERDAAWTCFTSDLSEEYVTENADYTT